MDSFQPGEGDSLLLAWNMATRFFLPIGIVVGAGFYISWKWGRIYCGWLCPHFSVVEMINGLMRRSHGKLSLWDKQTLPEHQQDGKDISPDKRLWILTAVAVVFFSFLWAVALLTYLLPPKEIYANLINGTLTGNQFRFIGVATVLLIIEFTFARHLFCRFGCAIGLFQSLIWMGNKNAMVVSFNREEAKECTDCDSSCDHACPMRLRPRSLKRKMFTCTQCMQCVSACENVQSRKNKLPLLKMLEGHCALHASGRDFGKRPNLPTLCYDLENQNKRSCCDK